MTAAETAIHRQVAAAREGSNPAVVARVESGWVVFGEGQVLPGYCLLLPDPVVPDLNALSPAARERFLLDMAAVGDALLEVTAARRINDEILGNLEPALHAHVIPRYGTEPEAHRTSVVWSYDWSAAAPFDRRQHGPLMAEVARALDARGVTRRAGTRGAVRGPGRSLCLRVLPERLATCRLEPGAPVPAWADGAPFSSVTRTADELSVTCVEGRVPDGVPCSRGWRALGLEGPFDLEETGILASVARPLAAAGVSLFAVATHDTDHVLVREEQLEQALVALARAGHAVQGAPRPASG